MARTVRPRASGRPRAARRGAVARTPRTRLKHPPQWLALLPGRRPDLLLHDRLASLALDAARDADRLWLVVAARADRGLCGTERLGRDARDRRPQRGHPPARLTPLHVRARGTDRRPRDRLPGGAPLGGNPVRGDPALRSSLPREVRRSHA